MMTCRLDKRDLQGEIPITKWQSLLKASNGYTKTALMPIKMSLSGKQKCKIIKKR